MLYMLRLVTTMSTLTWLDSAKLSIYYLYNRWSTLTYFDSVLASSTLTIRCIYWFNRPRRG